MDDKATMVAELLGDDSGELINKISVYLSAAEKEILAWRYSYSSQKVTSVPDEYDMVHVQAVIAGFNLSGAENQTQHSENGIARTFKYSDMLDYIRSHVIPIAGVF